MLADNPQADYVLRLLRAAPDPSLTADNGADLEYFSVQ